MKEEFRQRYELVKQWCQRALPKVRAAVITAWQSHQAAVARRVVLQGLGGAVLIALSGLVVLHYDRIRAGLVRLDNATEGFRNNLRERAAQSASPSKLKPRPPEPTPELSEYLAFLDQIGLRHFSSREIVRPHMNKREGVQNTIPPKSMWPNIVPTLKIVDELRERLGARATLLSLYRSPAYNTAIKGASQSQHMRNLAIDIKFSCSSTEAFEAVKEMREAGLFSGGLGWYPSFIHIDTRGRNATWGVDG